MKALMSPMLPLVAALALSACGPKPVKTVSDAPDAATVARYAAVDDSGVAIPAVPTIPAPVNGYSSTNGSVTFTGSAEMGR